MRRLLVLLIALLTVPAVLQWRQWPPPLPSAPVGGSVELPAPPERPVAALEDTRTRDDYLTVIERPLFLPERRPQPDEPTPAVATDGEVAEQLTGLDVNAILIASPDSASVWLLDPAAQDSLIRKRVGDLYKGWEITGIQPDRVHFERQGESETLELNDFAAAPARRPPPASRRLPTRKPQKTPPASQRSGADHDR